MEAARERAATEDESGTRSADADGGSGGSGCGGNDGTSASSPPDAAAVGAVPPPSPPPSSFRISHCSAQRLPSLDPRDVGANSWSLSRFAGASVCGTRFYAAAYDGARVLEYVVGERDGGGASDDLDGFGSCAMPGRQLVLRRVLPMPARVWRRCRGGRFVREWSSRWMGVGGTLDDQATSGGGGNGDDGGDDGERPIVDELVPECVSGGYRGAHDGGLGGVRGVTSFNYLHAGYMPLFGYVVIACCGAAGAGHGELLIYRPYASDDEEADAFPMRLRTPDSTWSADVSPTLPLIAYGCNKHVVCVVRFSISAEARARLQAHDLDTYGSDVRRVLSRYHLARLSAFRYRRCDVRVHVLANARVHGNNVPYVAFGNGAAGVAGVAEEDGGGGGGTGTMLASGSIDRSWCVGSVLSPRSAHVRRRAVGGRRWGAWVVKPIPVQSVWRRRPMLPRMSPPADSDGGGHEDDDDNDDDDGDGDEFLVARFCRESMHADARPSPLWWRARLADAWVVTTDDSVLLYDAALRALCRFDGVTRRDGAVGGRGSGAPYGVRFAAYSPALGVLAVAAGACEYTHGLRLLYLRYAEHAAEADASKVGAHRRAAVSLCDTGLDARVRGERCGSGGRNGAGQAEHGTDGGAAQRAFAADAVDAAAAMPRADDARGGRARTARVELFVTGLHFEGCVLFAPLAGGQLLQYEIARDGDAMEGDGEALGAAAW